MLSMGFHHSNISEIFHIWLTKLSSKIIKHDKSYKISLNYQRTLTCLNIYKIIQEIIQKMKQKWFYCCTDYITSVNMSSRSPPFLFFFFECLFNTAVQILTCIHTSFNTQINPCIQFVQHPLWESQLLIFCLLYNNSTIDRYHCWQLPLLTSCMQIHLFYSREFMRMQTERIKCNTKEEEGSLLNISP